LPGGACAPDDKAVAAFRAHQRALLYVHLEQHVVEGFEECVRLQLLWLHLRWKSPQPERLLCASGLSPGPPHARCTQQRRTAASRSARHSSFGKMCLRKSAALAHQPGTAEHTPRYARACAELHLASLQLLRLNAQGKTILDVLEEAAAEVRRHAEAAR